MIDWSNLWDPTSAAIVLGGTLLATLLRAGFQDAGATLRTIAGLLRKPFDLLAVRSELAGQVRAIRRDGIRRAEPADISDTEISEAADALAHRGDLQAALDTHTRHARRRDKVRLAALATLMQMAELAPIFGLAGTLFALAQLPAEGLVAGDLLASISTAVLSTLYGLLLAHLAVMPLARKIERRGETEEADRDALFTWLRAQLQQHKPTPLRTVGPDPAA